MTETGVLFVCTGNICRSPTAEGIFIGRVRGTPLEEKVFAASAGTHDYHAGDPPDIRAVRMAARRGVDISGLRARHFKKSDFDSHDFILALDGGHLDILRRMDPGGRRGKPQLLLSYAAGGDVSDPYYGGEDDFARAYDLIEQGVEGLVRHLEGQSA